MTVSKTVRGGSSPPGSEFNLFKKKVLKNNKILLFFKKTVSELKSVEWLERRMLVQYSVYVFSLLILGIIFILVVDKIFSLIRNILIPV